MSSEAIQSEATILSRPSCELEFRGAFAVTPSSLQSLDGMLGEFAKRMQSDLVGVTRWLSVWRLGPEPVQYNTFEAVVALRNEKTAQISTISLNAIGPNFKCRVMIDNDGMGRGMGFTFEGEADSADALFQLAAYVDSEQKNIRLWYSRVRATIDIAITALRRIPRWAWVIAVIFGVLLFAAWPAYLNHLHNREVQDWKQSGQQLVEAADKFSPGAGPELKKAIESLHETVANPPETRSVWSPLLGGLFGVLLGALLARTGFFFPRVVFEIGEGKPRHDHLRTLRTFVLGTIVISGVVLPRIRSLLGW